MMDRCRKLADVARRAGNTPVGSVLVVGAEAVAEAADAGALRP